MKAAVLYETGKPLIVEDGIEIPSLQSGQVLVKVVYSGVCRSQLMEVRGNRGEDAYLPHLLGHEGSGIVSSRVLGTAGGFPDLAGTAGRLPRDRKFSAGSHVYDTFEERKDDLDRRRRRWRKNAFAKLISHWIWWFEKSVPHRCSRGTDS